MGGSILRTATLQQVQQNVFPYVLTLVISWILYDG